MRYLPSSNRSDQQIKHRIAHLTMVRPKREFIQVARSVLFANVNVCGLHRVLKQLLNSFYSVDVMDAVNILTCTMLDCAVRVAARCK